MIISITGTPGTGKTYFAKKLAGILGFEYLELNKKIKENNLYEEYDEKTDSLIINEKKVSDFLKEYMEKYSEGENKIKEYFNEIYKKQNPELKKNPVDENQFYPMEKILNGLKEYKKENGLIIDSHLSHLFFPEKTDFCIVVKTGLKELKKRLEKRNYKEEKIKENLDSEIFNVCFNESIENNLKVIVVKN